MFGVALLIFALLVGYFLDQAIGVVIGALRWNNPYVFGEESIALSALVGYALSAGGAVYCYFSPVIRVGGMNIAAELKRVTWPSAGEIRVSTVAVIVASLISALIFFAFDSFSFEAMTKWVPYLLSKIAG